MFDRLDKLRFTHPVTYVLVFALGTLAGWSGAYMVERTFHPIGSTVSRWLGYEQQMEDFAKPLPPEVGQPKSPPAVDE